MTPTPSKSASGAAAHTAAEAGKPQESPGPFVLNLCSSTTPMALSNPEQPELKRFSFFVSRRFEEGRERFRLHMGYFATLAEAEEWLGAVRDIYPGAWAGEAPGKKLRERAVAAAAAQAQHAAGPPPVATTASNTTMASKPAVVPANVPTISAALPPIPKSGPASGTTPPAAPKMPALNVPTIHAAVPTARPATSNTVAASAGAPPPVARPVPGVARSVPQAAPARASAPSPVEKSAPVLPAAPAMAAKPLAAAPPVLMAAPPRAPSPSVATVANTRSAPVSPAASHSLPGAIARAGQPGRSLPIAQPAAPTATAAAPIAARRTEKPAKAALPNSNVREVLKALDEPAVESEITGETRLMPAPVLAGRDDPEDNSSFTDTQVLKFLETRRADGTELGGLEVESGAISLLKPDDTGTRRALKEAVAGNQPVAFAVQLQWSVQPVELSKVPPLAIFSAYTLYTVEGSRDGRKWYGLRLGFFTDAISAKQVAYYVRSEFASVAVVPVSPQEKSRASDSEKKADLAFPKKSRTERVDEFKLIDPDDESPSVPSRPAATPVGGKPALTKPAGPAKTTPPSGRRGSRGNRVRAREARTPQTLEETLEILGASQLEMDNGNGESLNESGVRHLRVEVQKNTPFGRLLERLSERVRKP